MTETWRPIDTLPDDPDLEVVASVWRESRHAALAVHRASFLHLHGDTYEFTHWAPAPVMPSPDPMTVVAAHPMDTLPDGHEQGALFKLADGTVRPDWGTFRKHDAKCARVAWCPLIPELWDAIEAWSEATP